VDEAVTVKLAPHKPAIFFVAVVVVILNDGNDFNENIKSRLFNGAGVAYFMC
jgi:hypothetical protein